MVGLSTQQPVINTLTLTQGVYMIDLCVRRTSIQSIQIKPKLTKKTIVMELANLDTGEIVIRFFNLKNGSDKAIE